MPPIKKSKKTSEHFSNGRAQSIDLNEFLEIFNLKICLFNLINSAHFSLDSDLTSFLSDQSSKPFSSKSGKSSEGKWAVSVESFKFSLRGVDKLKRKNFLENRKKCSLTLLKRRIQFVAQEKEIHFLPNPFK